MSSQIVTQQILADKLFQNLRKLVTKGCLGVPMVKTKLILDRR